MGGLPPPRPDQVERETPRGVAAGQRLLRLGGVPTSAGVLGATAQAPTAFYTFGQAGRLFTAGLSFAAVTNGAYTPGVLQLYARVTTQSGLVLCSVQLAIFAAGTGANGGDRFTGPQAGVPVAKGDKLILDVNNGVIIPGGNGVMHADCEVFFSLP